MRESFHTLKYLAKQTAPRDEYEIIWIEYYSTRKAMYHDADKFIIMGMPTDLCYHKHLMYNVGILHARGEIVCFCDSDGIYKNTFVASILSQFNRNPHIVLHLDQVRNKDRSFYPFNYPTIQQVISGKKTNWRNGSTHGLLEQGDPLHQRNYGACMAALKDDLLRIGGADEHIDYLGYICGPYEMTFRLINAGCREVWHPSEFSYHVWHPNEGNGRKEYEGPHDGRNMSTRALNLIRNKRVLPWVKNPVFDDPAAELVAPEKFQQWLL